MSNISGRLLLVLAGYRWHVQNVVPRSRGRINNGDSSVAAMKENRSCPEPPGATIQFDQQPGTERLLALVSWSNKRIPTNSGIDWQKQSPFRCRQRPRLLYQKLNHTTGYQGIDRQNEPRTSRPADLRMAVVGCPVPPGAAKRVLRDVVTTGCADSSGAATPPKV